MSRVCSVHSWYPILLNCESESNLKISDPILKTIRLIPAKRMNFSVLVMGLPFLPELCIRRKTERRHLRIVASLLAGFNHIFTSGRGTKTVQVIERRIKTLNIKAHDFHRIAVAIVFYLVNHLE